MRFTAFGHKNILATHKTTLEFTKHKTLTEKGDCIIAVNADFDAEELKKLARESKELKVTIEVEGRKEEIVGSSNPDFDDNEEIVVRMGDFASKRTLIVRADKAARQLDRNIVEKLREGKKAAIKIEKIR